MSDEQQGSFIGGLALGMFAGAAGFFLFGTKDGSKFRQKIDKEWQEAKACLEKDGVIKDRNASVMELIRDWFGLEVLPKKLTKKKLSKTAPTKTRKKTTSESLVTPVPKSTKKFKGV